jgi:hypothetical protein
LKLGAIYLCHPPPLLASDQVTHVRPGLEGR